MSFRIAVRLRAPQQKAAAMSMFLSRLGRFSARHRLVVVAGWIVILAALGGILATGSSESSSSVSVPSSAASKTLSTVQSTFPGAAASAPDTLQLVISTTDGTAITAATAAPVERVLTEARAVSHVASVTNPLDARTPYVSADQTTAVATVTFTGLTDDDRQTVYDHVLAVADQAPSPLRIEVGGQIVPDGAPPAGAGEIIGVLVAFLVLFLTFGSLIVAGANLLVAVVGVSIGATGILAYGTVSPLGDTTITLAAMLGLAVGIDYSLFILTRFRSELREGRQVEDAIGRATGTAGSAVVFAGLTVIIALAALSVVRISFITEMGLAAAFAVLVAVLMAFTLLPVLLRCIGHRILPRRERSAAPRTSIASRGRRSPLTLWIEAIIRRPLIAIVGAVAVLLLCAVPLLSMKTASSVPGGLDPTSTQRVAYDEIQDAFGGVQSPLLVLLTGEHAAASTATVVSELTDLPGVQSVEPGATTTAGDAALVTVIPTGSPLDDSTKDLVHAIRDDADSVSGVHLAVTGETAIGIDGDAALAKALIEYLIVIVGLAFVLMVMMFRSILVPLTATLGYLLSVGASFGASVAVFQWGWLDAIIPAPQGDPMLSTLPIILVGVLFGLAMDYQVFLVSRIHEMRQRGYDPAEAVRRGFTRSGPVLVAAATIMTVVFGGFASSPMTVAASIAFGLVVGVMADAFLVRMVIMPALLVIMGDTAWWIPAWLDRILPDLDVEGHALDAEPTSHPEPTETPVLV